MIDTPKHDDPHKVEKMTASREGGTDMPPSEDGGEDEGGVATDGDEDGVHEDQKPAKN